MTTSQIPDRQALKEQAKRLRQDLSAKGTPITHAQALETVAHQWGARDWNTLSAQAPQTPLSNTQTGWVPGNAVSGRYLGHSFTGVIKGAQMHANGHWDVTVRFDAAIDVVTSKHFSNLRSQVSATVDKTGRSPRKTSDGQPQMVLDLD